MYPPPPWTARPPLPQPIRPRTGGREVAIWLLSPVVATLAAIVCVVGSVRDWFLVGAYGGAAWIGLLVATFWLGPVAERAEHPRRAWVAFAVGVTVAAASMMAVCMDLAVPVMICMIGVTEGWGGDYCG